MVGFSFREDVRGSYWRLDAPLEVRPWKLAFEARARALTPFLRDRVWEVTGTLDADGLATARPVEGSILFRLFDERRLPYRLRFVGDDGRRYEVSGQKEWQGVAPLSSLTTLSCSVYDEGGVEVGRGDLALDFRRGGGRWLRSFRLRGSRR